MGWIKQAPSGKYKACYRDASGAEHSKTFALKRDARRYLDSMEVAKSRGEWLDPRLGNLLFGTWANDWLTSQPQLRATTRDREGRALRNHLLPTFGAMRLSSISTQTVRTWIGSMLSDEALAHSTVRQVGLLLSKVMRGAVASGLIARNPCDGVSLPVERARPMIFLTPAEIGRLAAAVPDHYRCLVLTAAYTGLRWGELVGLRLQNVDLDRSVIVVVEQVIEISGAFTTGAPKSAAGRRSVALPPSLSGLLAAHVRDLAIRPHDPVFTSPEGTFLRRSNFRRRVWIPSIAASGLDSRLRFHDLRHIAVALAISQGAHVKAIQERMGHASAQMTLDRYGHLLPALQGELAERLDASFQASAGNLLRPASGLTLIEGTALDTGDDLEQDESSGASWNRTSDLTLIRGAL